MVYIFYHKLSTILDLDQVSSHLESSKVYTAAPQGQESKSFNYRPITHHN